MHVTLSARLRRASGVVVAAVLLATVAAGPATAEPTNPRALENLTAQITLMSITDLHCRVVNWDYLNDQPYSSGRGLSRIDTLVEQLRAERGAESTLLLDVGDTIQGTPLCAYYALRDPITEGSAHPVATAMNAMGFDTMTVGNHEFNFGLPTLYEFERQLDAPMLSANVVYAGTDEPAFTPYVIKTLKLKGKQPINVGILGLTTPGVAVWDRTNVEGILEFRDGVETAKQYVPKMLAAGADVIVAAVHTGMSGGSSYGGLIPYSENFGTALAEQVPGIDVILPGHSHATINQQFVTNLETGEQVLVTQPGSAGQRLSVSTLTLTKITGKWEVTDKAAETLRASDATDAPMIDSLVADEHETVVDYVNSPIGTTLGELSLAQADVRDVPAMDLVNFVEAKAVEDGLEGTAYADLPVLATTAPLSRVVIPAGPVSIRDIAALYIYENTLRGIVMTGADIKDYLERAALYFDPVSSTGPFDRADVGNNGPTYCYDVVYGVSFEIDLANPEGSRIENLSYNGTAVDPADEFVLAINNYRHGGGCGYPHVTTAPVVYNVNPEIQGLLISWFEANETIDPATFGSVDWMLTYMDAPISFNP